MIWRIPDRLITQEMCDLAFEKDPVMMIHFPNRCITQEMCDKAFEKDPNNLIYISRLFHNRRDV